MLEIIFMKSGDMKRGIYNSCLGAALVVALLCFGPSDSYGQFPMGNTLAPIAGNDYPIVYANDAKGGHHQVANIAARNAITTLRRQVGMLCTVMENSAGSDGSGVLKTYQLICADIQTARDNNANWVLFTPGGGTLGWSALTGNPFTITTPIAGQLLRFDGTNWVNVDKATIPINGFGSAIGNISMGDGGSNNFTINNLAEPSGNQDAATKNYVDINSGGNAGLVTTEMNRAKAAEGTNATAIALKADIASPNFTGNPTAPTPLSTDASTLLATTAFVNAAVIAIPNATNSIYGKILLAGDLTGSADLPVIAAGKITDSKLDKANIPLSGFALPVADISMGSTGTNFKITNLALPTTATDAATKGYVDAGPAVDGKIYKGTVTDMTAFSVLAWADVSAATDLGHSIPSTICALEVTNYTWIAFPSAWGNQSFFYQYGGISYAVVDGLQKRVIKAALTGSVDYQIWFFNTKPNAAAGTVSLIANNN